MQITTATASETTEMATSNVNENNMPDVDQQETQSNKQVCKNKNGIKFSKTKTK
jgi:hypothetical protein